MADETILKDVHDKGTTFTTDDQVNTIKCTREQLIEAQEQDAELRPLIDDVVSEEEVHKYANCFTDSLECSCGSGGPPRCQPIRSGKCHIKSCFLGSFERRFCPKPMLHPWLDT